MLVVMAAVRIAIPVAIVYSADPRAARAHARGRRGHQPRRPRPGRRVGRDAARARRPEPAPAAGARVDGREAAPVAFVDADGHPAELPPPGDRLTATVLERDGEVLGALVHDAALREEPELLDAVAAAARLALHNERLADEVRAQLAEVQESRRRIVASGEAERRRLERDLHDGAQQRLVALALRAARDRAARRRAAASIALADELDARRRRARRARSPTSASSPAASARPCSRSRASGRRSRRSRTALPLPVTGRRATRRPAPRRRRGHRLLRRRRGARQRAQARGRAARPPGRPPPRTASSCSRSATTAAAARTRRSGSGLVGLADRLEAIGGSLTVAQPRGRRHHARRAHPFRRCSAQVGEHGGDAPVLGALSRAGRA